MQGYRVKMVGCEREEMSKLKLICPINGNFCTKMECAWWCSQIVNNKICEGCAMLIIAKSLNSIDVGGGNTYRLCGVKKRGISNESG